jgi:glutaredoxin
MAIHSPIGLSELQKMKSGRIRLFIKPPCGWCRQAKEWLEVRGIQYETLEVTADAAARQEMLERSGQTLAPVIQVDGPVLADFDPDQLAAFGKTLK